MQTLAGLGKENYTNLHYLQFLIGRTDKNVMHVFSYF